MTSQRGTLVAEAGVITRTQVAQARKDLGRQLAAWRDAAELTQVDLARRTCYSRSAVANVEIGRQNISRPFWQQADRLCGAAGALLAAFDQLEAVVRAFQTQTARVREEQRTPRYAPPPSVATGCGCGLAVGLWTGQETRALREAMRMTVRVFAKYLGVTTATVSGWEHRDAPTPPRLSTQALLDQALKDADADAKTRFALILRSLPPGACSDASESPVTPLHRPERARTAS
ncbi:helix-turn-helix domain-containing protein [Plantactinospora sp. WMMB334]|uniref:helix-turn-helix domain-containing protein n=1 Tax=Plantactinospora sp. WMMB334 TaxID=3404119 RepID=UPI003B95B487